MNSVLIVSAKFQMMQFNFSPPSGELPSDEQIRKLSSFLPPFQPNDKIKIPKEFRDTFTKTVSPSVEALSDAGVLPVLNQLVVTLEQIPKLVDEVRRIANPIVCSDKRYSIPKISLSGYQIRRSLLGRETLPLRRPQ